MNIITKNNIISRGIYFINGGIYSIKGRIYSINGGIYSINGGIYLLPEEYIYYRKNIFQ